MKKMKICHSKPGKITQKWEFSIDTEFGGSKNADARKKCYIFASGEAI